MWIYHVFADPATNNCYNQKLLELYGHSRGSLNDLWLWLKHKQHTRWDFHLNRHSYAHIIIWYKKKTQLKQVIAVLLNCRCLRIVNKLNFHKLSSLACIGTLSSTVINHPYYFLFTQPFYNHISDFYSTYLQFLPPLSA